MGSGENRLSLVMQCYNPAVAQWTHFRSPNVPRHLSAPLCCTLLDGSCIYLVGDNTQKVNEAERKFIGMISQVISIRLQNTSFYLLWRFSFSMPIRMSGREPTIWTICIPMADWQLLEKHCTSPVGTGKKMVILIKWNLMILKIKHGLQEGLCHTYGSIMFAPPYYNRMQIHLVQKEYPVACSKPIPKIFITFATPCYRFVSYSDYILR